jgi:hypothetical protein
MFILNLLDFFIFQEKVVGKTNTPKHRRKNMEFTEYFSEERSGGVAANDKQPQDGN